MACASHMMNVHIAESTLTRNPAIVTRPFSLAEGVGSGHETTKYGAKRVGVFSRDYGTYHPAHLSSLSLSTRL